MKRLSTRILTRTIVFAMILGGTSIAFASGARGTRVLVNGQTASFSQPLDTVQGTLLAPIRPIADLMGAETRWNSETRTITVIHGNTGIAAAIDNQIMTVRNMTTGGIRQVTLPVSPRISNGAEYYPVEVMVKEFGATVTWDETTNTIHIMIPPLNVRAETPETDRVTISWNSAGSGISYRVYYSTQNDPSRANTYVSASGTSISVSNLNSNTNYFFWVSSIRNGQESAKSSVVSVRTTVLQPILQMTLQNLQPSSSAVLFGKEKEYVEETIKHYETLLSQNPDNEGLLLTIGSLLIIYANAFVEWPAEMLDPIDYYYERYEASERAKKLYLRGTAYLKTALEKKFPGFSAATVESGSLESILKKCRRENVPLLYWNVAGEIAAYNLDIFDFELGYQIPKWDAMIARAYELDPDFDNGAIDELYIMYYAMLPENLGGDKDKAEIHFKRALEKSNYLSAGPYVSYVKFICIGANDYDAFRENLEKALAINPDANPSSWFLNDLSQKKARYLLDTAHEYFTFP
ncbi:MAG: fibronectin type III domain-containing protein [Treponema sp.]|jgi:predicted anti-sigma-YlaC factor YlaD|nr:fibronectin type III domain-containing protein [Treponema sp.]